MTMEQGEDVPTPERPETAGTNDGPGGAVRRVLAALIAYWIGVVGLLGLLGLLCVAGVVEAFAPVFAPLTDALDVPPLRSAPASGRLPPEMVVGLALLGLAFPLLGLWAGRVFNRRFPGRRRRPFFASLLLAHLPAGLLWFRFQLFTWPQTAGFDFVFSYLFGLGLLCALYLGLLLLLVPVSTASALYLWPRSRSAPAWRRRMAFVAPLLIWSAPGLLFYGFTNVPNRPPAEERLAIRNIRWIQGVQVIHHSRTGGYAPALQQLDGLTDPEMKGIDPILMTGRLDGYSYRMQGREGGYAIWADPIGGNPVGRHFYALVPEGQAFGDVRYERGVAAGPQSPVVGYTYDQ